MRSVQVMSRRIGALALGIALLVVLLAAVPARAQFSPGLINVDFNFNASATQTGAAILGFSGDVWNGITTTSGQGPFVLVDSTGVANGVNLTTNNVGTLGPFNPLTPFAATPYEALMQDAATPGVPGPEALILSGLTPNQAYELYFYSQTNAGVGGTSTYIIAGNPQPVNYDGTTGTFIEGITYAHFASETANISGNLVIGINGSGTFPGIINGFQIRPVPEPASLGVLGLAAIGLMARRRRA